MNYYLGYLKNLVSDLLLDFLKPFTSFLDTRYAFLYCLRTSLVYPRYARDDFRQSLVYNINEGSFDVRPVVWIIPFKSQFK
jgi:hypothetical protein